MAYTRATRLLVASTAAILLAGGGLAYSAVASQAADRSRTPVVTFDIQKVMDNLTQRADLAAELSERLQLIQDKIDQDLADIGMLEEQLAGEATSQQKVLAEELEQKKLAMMSYQRFARSQVDIERSLILRDLHREIQDAVSDIAKANGYDLVLINDSGMQITVNPESNLSREQQVREQVRAQRVFFADSGIDITDQVVTQMNLGWNARTSG
ncbi:MAG: OmpH family outer membrane protein [Phycisphaerales bacterium]|nr:OmpH family outer membrane protein [Phycisphaerales bacterium]